MAHHAKRVVRMRDGRIVSDQRVAAPTDLPPRWSGAQDTAAMPSPAMTNGVAWTNGAHVSGNGSSVPSPYRRAAERGAPP